jgi:hypothetical protein
VSGGKLEEALEQYKRSRKHGIERAEMHIRNVSTLRYTRNCLAHGTWYLQVGAKLLGQMAEKEKLNS